MSDEFETEVLSEEDALVEEAETENDVPASEADPLEGVDVANDSNLPDTSTVVTLRSSGGETRYVPTDGEKTVADLILDAGLRLGSSFTIWMDGVEMKGGDKIPAGKTLTILTSVKGG